MSIRTITQTQWRQIHSLDSAVTPALTHGADRRLVLVAVARDGAVQFAVTAVDGLEWDPWMGRRGLRGDG